MTSIRSRLIVSLGAFGGLLLLALVVGPLVGSTSISLRRVFDPSLPFADNVDAQIFFIARLPRVAAAAMVGASLAAAGVVFQALLRNPLAGPDTVGVSSGAALGAMMAIVFGWDLTVAGGATIPVAGLLGSFGALAIVYALATARRRGLSSTVLLLAGVTMTAFFTALILFIQYLADANATFRTVRWLMGSLDVGGWGPLVAMVPVLAVAFALFVTLPRPLDLISLGVDAAAARGVDVARAERTALVSASLATGAAVSVGGPIGFVGIIVPHVVRLLVGSDHRLVLPGSALFGAAFLVGCDAVARTVFAPVEIPVGVITALIGGPFFLWLLLQRV